MKTIIMIAFRGIGLILALGQVGCFDVDRSERNKEARFETVEAYLSGQLDGYYRSHGRYPDALNELRITILPRGINTNF